MYDLNLISLLSYALAWFAINFLFSVPVVYIFRKWQRKEDVADLNKKNEVFERTDAIQWKTFRFILLGTLLGGPLRFVGCFVLVGILMIILRALMVGYEGNNAPIGKVRLFLINWNTLILTRLMLFGCGVWWINKSFRSDKCYRKYLGPEWKASFEGAGI